MSAPRARRIAVVTGTRAEFGALRSTLLALRSRKNVQLQLVVVGLHLLPRFGRTSDDIRRQGFRIDARVPMQRGDDSPTDQAFGLSRGIAGMARYFDRAKTDIVVVLGDRIEALAGALAAVTTGRVLAHIHGGDVAPGDFDDSLRHSITKLAHLHLTATAAARRRVIRLGERPGRVFCVGAPGLDDLRAMLTRRPAARRRDDAPILVVQHATGRPAAVERRVMSAILGEVARIGRRHTIIYPNSDRGHEGVIAAIRSHARIAAGRLATIHRSLTRDEYLRTLIGSAAIVGNSSSGIIESPLAGVPTVDVGDRQQGREHDAGAVMHVGESAAEIAAAIKRALRANPRASGRSVYGDGRSGERIARVLAAVELTRDLRRKVIAY